MTHNQYQARQLATLLEELQSKQVSGTLYLDASLLPQRKKRSHVLVWKNGRIVYGGLNIPNNQEFTKMLGQKFKRGDLIDAAISLARQKATERTSVRELLELLVKMRLFSWEQIESIVYTSIVLTLEQVLPHAGQFQFDSTAEFNVCRGLELSQVMQDVARRQQQWSALAPLIPSPEAVPLLPANALETISAPAVHQHLQESVDRQRSLVDIAETWDKDPLSLAQSYRHWVQAGWVMFEGSTKTKKSDLATILAVDDSLVMQTMIDRVLSNHYQVLVASNAADGLKLLHHNRVALLLLDVTMPDMDGLELCRKLRSMSEFRNLPIVMLTARDGLLIRPKVRSQARLNI